jgi:hypothetical protein
MLPWRGSAVGLLGLPGREDIYIDKQPSVSEQ